MALGRIAALVILFLSTVSPLVAAQDLPAEPSVWYWSTECKTGHAMGLDVVVDGKTAIHFIFTACRGFLEDANDQTARREFAMNGGHTFQGMYRTKRTEKIECDLWQAGADPGDILVGISFMNSRRVLLNTIHIVRPDKASRSTIDAGIVVRTYPLKANTAAK